jgi:toxin HigB-1
LEISFSTKELRDLCEQEALAITNIGIRASQALKNRLSDLQAADGVYDVLAGRPSVGLVGTNECYFFELADRYVLTITANHAQPRTVDNGQTDWSRVRRVKVLSVEQ